MKICFDRLIKKWFDAQYKWIDNEVEGFLDNEVDGFLDKEED